MIKLACKIPNKVTLACSGGSDSMVALDFLIRGKKQVRVAYFNHGTIHGAESEQYLKAFCRIRNLELVTGQITEEKSSLESPEEYWRNQRLNWFHSLSTPVITAHHLDDVVEWWIFSSLNGHSRLIPLRNKNIFRPFLLTSKGEIKNWAQRKEVYFLKDPSNENLRFARNRIRHNLMPEILKINPGIHTVVKKKIENQIKSKLERPRPAC
ncbi:tRNA lysidine(34) synthetase TilS [bacterium]|nr:tRNA lysidine(34) synthetase TilS [bacterium]|tara:strand:- start:433 stop:1062 length:630 start_codon:yes stop_codon:yes gene_type:complete